MRKSACERKQDLRTTLMSSVVIGSFEPFLGNHGSAVKQAIIGLELIQRGALYDKATVSQVEDEIILHSDVSISR